MNRCFLRGGMLTLLALVLTAAVEEPLREPKPLRFDKPYADGPVYVVNVEGMVENALARYIDRAIAEATEADAALLVFHIDTFGGLLDAADHIRKALLNAPMPTVAFIDRNAASAGALIAYATDRIVMVPGASIGAATVVEGAEGEKAPDKYQSYMRGLMRATAEANGRDPSIAEAMVDEAVIVEGVKEEGKVLTLSSQEALELGVADAILDNTDALLAGFGLSGAEVLEHRATRSEEVLRFLSSPILQSILLLMMLGGLYFELQHPGVGLPAVLALLGAVLFFWPHYVLGLVESWEFIAFIVGVALILVEIMLIPGFGVAGVAGIILVTGSLFLGLIGNVGFDLPSGSVITSAISTLAVTLVLLVVLMFSLGRYLPRTQQVNRLVLHPELSSAAGFVATDALVELSDRIGVTLTPLKPTGAAEIEGTRVEVVSDGAFIPAGTSVRVVRVRGSRVEVRPVEAIAAAAATSKS